MFRRTRIPHLSTLVIVPMVLAGCASRSSVEGEPNQGTLRLALSSAAPSGMNYTLCEGVLSVTGDALTTAVVVSEHLDEASIGIDDLPVGAYDVTLDGWTLCRNDGEALVPVSATLLGEAQQTVEIFADETSTLTYRFSVNGEVAGPTGGLDVGIEVVEEGNESGLLARLTASKDTTVRGDLDARRNDNYGCDFALCVGSGRGGAGIEWGGGDAMRAIVQFDLSSFSVSVARAVLELHVVQDDRDGLTEDMRLSAHRILPTAGHTPWEEGNGSEAPGYPPSLCTNVDSASGVAWDGANDTWGDANNRGQPSVSDESVAEFVIVGTEPVPTGMLVEFDVTSLVNGWIRGEYENHGLMLRELANGEDFQGIFFGSREGDLYDFSDERQQPGPRLRLYAE